MRRFKFALVSSALMVLGFSSAFWPSTTYASPSLSPPPVKNGWVQVSTADELKYIDQNQRSYLSSNIEIMNDIHMSSRLNWTPFGGQTSGSFSPSSPEAPFSGQFNGQGHEITGLNITDDSDRYVGFFGATTGIIENLGIDATVSAVTTSAPSVGGFVGDIVGGSISDSYATGSVKGSGVTGAFVGSMHSGSISNSYATGSVTGVSYAIVSPIGGGFVGYTHGGSISNSYATGHVTVDGLARGFVGYAISGSSITNSYFDKDTTGQTSSGFSGGVTSETTTLMQTPRTFSGWSTLKWALYKGQYPLLSWQVPLTISVYATPKTVGAGGKVAVTGSVYSSKGTSLAGIRVTLSDNASGSWLHASVITDVNGQFTDTWTAPNSTTNAALTASVDGANVQKQRIIQVQAYTVTYNGNGNSGGAVPTDTNTYRSGSSTRVIGNTGNLTKTGFKFSGWSTNTNGSGTVYQSGDIMKMPSSNVTFYAKWNPIPYTVTFKSNGGSSVSPQSVKYGSHATQPTDPTKTGYKFAGWYSNSGLSTPYSFSTPVITTETLYAKWTVDPSVSTSTLLNVLEGTSYSQDLKGAGGISPYTFTVSSGSLPNGLALQSDGSLVGTPQQSGTFHFSVQIKDHAGTTTTKDMSVYVIPTAPAGYLKSISTKQVVGNSGGTLTAKSNHTTATLVISSGAFTNPLQMDITTGTVSSSLVPSGWDVVAAYGVNFDTNDSPSHPLSFTLLNAGITPQSKVYKIVNGNLIPVTAQVTKGKAVITFTTDPDFVVLQPKPVPQATKPVTAFPAFPWAAGGLLSILTGGLALWLRKHRRTIE